MGSIPIGSNMTEKMNMFVIEYLKDWNATQAAIRAGYSEKTAWSQGYENLRKPEIAEAIEKAKKEIIGDSIKDIIENIEFWRKMRDDVEAPEAARLKASEHIGKYRAMFTDKIEHTTIDENGEPTGFKIEFVNSNTPE